MAHGLVLELQLLFLQLDDLADVLVVQNLLVEAQTDEDADDDQQDCGEHDDDGQGLLRLVVDH